MKSSNKKPKTWEWIIYLAFIPIGILCSNLYSYENILSIFFISSGIGGTIGLLIRRSNYNDLTPEEQREVSRMDTDERNVAIRGRAAWIAYNVNLLVLCASSILFLHLERRAEANFCAAILVLNVLISFLSKRYLEKKL